MQNVLARNVVRPDVDVDLVARAGAMVQTLRERHAETDLAGKAPASTHAELGEAGMFSLTVPRIYGGHQVDTTLYKDVVSELGRGDAGVAWAVSLVNACNWMGAALYPKHVADEIFDKPDARCAGVFSSRACKARKAPGGIFIEKGMWFFNSGVYHAQWDLLGVPMFDDAGEPTGPGIAVLPISDVNILHDWDTMGLRGSGSSNVSVENVFVPDERIVALKACNEGTALTQFADDAAYRTAFAPLMMTILSFPVLGAGMHMLEEFMATLPKRDIKLTPYTKQAEAVATHLQIAEASAMIEGAKTIIAKACADMDRWARRLENMPLIERAASNRDVVFADQLLWRATDLLATSSGGSFARKGGTLNRIWGDIKVGTMHPFVSVPSNYENYGRIAAGIDGLIMPI